MASVLLLSAVPREDDAFHRLKAFAARDRFGIHTLTEDAEAADLILFVESFGVSQFFEEVRRHPFLKKYREKCFCFGERNAVVPFLPGVYFDLEKRFYASDRTRGGFFLWEFTNPYVAFSLVPDDAPYLYSFIGSVFTHEIREKVMRLEHPGGYVRDTGQEIKIWETGTQEEKDRYWRRYGDLCTASKFMLCPRGTSPATVRCFDAMKVGRAPVIIADQWVAPEGPDWDDFSIRVQEKDVMQIPEMLEAREPQAAAMGLRARQAWDDWFGETVCFHRIVEWCLDIERTRRLPESVLRYKGLAQLLFSRHRLRNYVVSRVDMVRHEHRLVF